MVEKRNSYTLNIIFTTVNSLSFGHLWTESQAKLRNSN